MSLQKIIKRIPAGNKGGILYMKETDIKTYFHKRNFFYLPSFV